MSDPLVQHKPLYVITDPQAGRGLLSVPQRQLPRTTSRLSLSSNCAQFTTVISPMSHVSLEQSRKNPFIPISISSVASSLKFFSAIINWTCCRVHRQRRQRESSKGHLWENQLFEYILCVSFVLKSVVSIQVLQLQRKQKLRSAVTWV